MHSRSGLNLTRTRAYAAIFGRFLNRDPIEETAGINVFAYVGNCPVSLTDPSGLGSDPCAGLCGWALFICKSDNDPCKNTHGLYRKLCRTLHPNSNPNDYVPYDPSTKTPSELFDDGAPRDVIEQRLKELANGDMAELDRQVNRLQLHIQQIQINIQNAQRQQMFQFRQQIVPGR